MRKGRDFPEKSAKMAVMGFGSQDLCVHPCFCAPQQPPSLSPSPRGRRIATVLLQWVCVLTPVLSGFPTGGVRCFHPSLLYTCWNRPGQCTTYKGTSTHLPQSQPCDTSVAESKWNNGNSPSQRQQDCWRQQRKQSAHRPLFLRGLEYTQTICYHCRAIHLHRGPGQRASVVRKQEWLQQRHMSSGGGACTPGCSGFCLRPTAHFRTLWLLVKALAPPTGRQLCQQGRLVTVLSSSTAHTDTHSARRL